MVWACPLNDRSVGYVNSLGVVIFHGGAVNDRRKNEKARQRRAVSSAKSKSLVAGTGFEPVTFRL
jgi:hypothetical protein